MRVFVCLLWRSNIIVTIDILSMCFQRILTALDNSINAPKREVKQKS